MEQATVKRTATEMVRSACSCLYLEVDPSIAKDVRAKVEDVISELVAHKSALAQMEAGFASYIRDRRHRVVMSDKDVQDEMIDWLHQATEEQP